MSDTVIGIDPSLTGLAVCVYCRTGTHVIRCFSATATQGNVLPSRFDRYWRLANQVRDWVKEYQPSAVFLEGYGSSARGHGQVPMIEFGAIMRTALIEQCNDVYWAFPPREVAPASLKKFVTGKGNADKLAVCLAIQKRYGVTFETNDEFDAYGLARMAACHVGWEEPANDKQREAIASLRGEKPAKKKKAS